MNFPDEEIQGNLWVSVTEDAECYGGRRIHLRFDGLPGWLLSLIAEGGTLVKENSSYRSDRPSPNSIMFGTSRVLAMQDRRPPKKDPHEVES